METFAKQYDETPQTVGPTNRQLYFLWLRTQYNKHVKKLTGSTPSEKKVGISAPTPSETPEEARKRMLAELGVDAPPERDVAEPSNAGESAQDDAAQRQLVGETRKSAGAAEGENEGEDEAGKEVAEEDEVAEEVAEEEEEVAEGDGEAEEGEPQQEEEEPERGEGPQPPARKQPGRAKGGNAGKRPATRRR